MANDIHSMTQALPPQYTTNISVDPRGFVRIDGVCIGRLLTERDEILFEVRDRYAARAMARGAEIIRIPVKTMIHGLTEYT